MTSRGTVAACLGLSVAWTVIACARTQAPSGGPVPEADLQVIETRPANLSVVEAFDDAVEIVFPRTLAQRVSQGTLANAMIVSPQSGEVEVSRSGARLEVSMEGGFLAGEIYQITVLPRFTDRFQNTMASAFELLFSTGPELEPNLIAGLVSDRLSLDPAEEVRVDALVDDRGVVRSVITDTTGVFSVGYLTAGAYLLRAFEDNNGDGSPGFNEPQDSTALVLVPGDTLIVTDLELLAPDTTAAVLDDVEALDSISVLAEFDDYLDPLEPLDEIDGTVSSEDGDLIDVIEVLHRVEWDERQAAATPEPDTVSADADPVVEPAPVDAVGGDTGPLLPSQEIVLILEEPLEGEQPYEIEVSGVRNIHGLPDGGGSAELIWSPPPPPPEVPPTDPDAPAPGDVPPDSAAVPPGAAGPLN